MKKRCVCVSFNNLDFPKMFTHFYSSLFFTLQIKRSLRVGSNVTLAIDAATVRAQSSL